MLVDAHSVYPKPYRARRVFKVDEPVPQVFANHELLMIQLYLLKPFRVAPHVGQGVVFWLVRQASERERSNI
jgi:hypothetical protein